MGTLSVVRKGSRWYHTMSTIVISRNDNLCSFVYLDRRKPKALMGFSTTVKCMVFLHALNTIIPPTRAWQCRSNDNFVLNTYPKAGSNNKRRSNHDQNPSGTSTEDIRSHSFGLAYLDEFRGWTVCTSLEHVHV